MGPPLDAMRIIKKIDKIIAEDKDKIIETSFKRGTYAVPKKLRDILSEETISTDGLQTLIHTTDFITRSDLVLPVLYEYAARLVHTPIQPASDPEKTKLNIANAIFQRNVDEKIARIILDHALIKTAKYVTNPIRLDPDNTPNIYSMYGGYPTDCRLYLCPTASKDAFYFAEILGTYSSIKKKIQQTNGEYGSPLIIDGSPGRDFPTNYNRNTKYKMPAFDISYDRTRRADIAVIEDASCYLNLFSRVDQNGFFSGEPQKRILLGNEADSSNAKVIFRRNSHELFLKLKNNIFLCDTDDDFIGLNLNNPINAEQIDDLWAKKYLLEEDPLSHSCAKMAYSSVPTVPFFNTRYLHALEFEEAQKEALQAQLFYIYQRPSDIIECVCDPNYDTHFYLSKEKNRKTQNYYNLTNVSFQPDVRMQAALDFMNRTQQNQSLNTPLYVDALCIYQLSTNDWVLTPAQLSAKMGAFYPLVSQELKNMMTQPSRGSLYFAQIKHFIMPYISRPYVKFFGAFSLAALGTAAVLKLPKEYQNKAVGALLLGGASYYLNYWLRPKLFTRSNP